MILGVALSERNEESGKLPCQTILDMLKFSSVFTGNIMMEEITVIKPTTNKSCCKNLPFYYLFVSKVTPTFYV